MTAAEIETKISEVDAAIDAVLLGQNYSIDTNAGRQTVTRASLPNLRAYRAELERRLSRTSTDGRPISGEVRR